MDNGSVVVVFDNSNRSVHLAVANAITVARSWWWWVAGVATVADGRHGQVI